MTPVQDETFKYLDPDDTFMPEFLTDKLMRVVLALWVGVLIAFQFFAFSSDSQTGETVLGNSLDSRYLPWYPVIYFVLVCYPTTRVMLFRSSRALFRRLPRVARRPVLFGFLGSFLWPLQLALWPLWIGISLALGAVRKPTQTEDGGWSVADF